MLDYPVLKVIHIISSTILFGTGLGSAFYKWKADREGNIGAIVFANKNVVLADWIFTTPAILIQPATGLLIVFQQGYNLTSTWLLASIILYVIAGLCWIPVVWLQMRMRDLAVEAHGSGTSLSAQYHSYGRKWFVLGIPAFSAVVAVFFLMVIKPG